MKRILFTLLCTGIFGLAACSSEKKESEDTEGMEMPVTLSVAQSKEDEQKRDANSSALKSVSGLSLNYAKIISALTDPTTDFMTDEQHVWVHDKALEPLAAVNTVLCLAGQTGANQLVNRTYVALVDTARCEREGDTKQGQNQASGGGKTPVYQTWIVDSRRANNSSPQIVKIWMNEKKKPTEDYDFDKHSRAEIVITEGVSDANPYGKFTLNFVNIADEAATNGITNQAVAIGDTVMTGTLKTVDTADGNIGFTLYQDVPYWQVIAKVSVVTDPTQTSGVALTGMQLPEWDGVTVTYPETAHAVAYNSTNLLIKSDDGAGNDLTFADLDTIDGQMEGNGAVCRSRTQHSRNIWRYDLYHATDGTYDGKAVTAGQRVDLNSGFPFRADTDGDTLPDTYGYVGYWGLWSEKSPTAGWDGATITKQVAGTTATAENYSVHQAEGKMIKRVRDTILLSELNGETFYYTECTAACVQYLVEYTSDTTLSVGGGPYTADKFYKTHTVDWAVTPPEAAIAPVAIDTGANPWVGLWSVSLGGAVLYINTDPTNVIFYKETVMDGNDAAFGGATKLTFNCYLDCLVPGMTSVQYQDPHGVDPAYVANASTTTVPAAVYELDKATMTFSVVEVNGVTQTAAEITAPACTITGGAACKPGEPWGIRSGAMVDVAEGLTLANVWDTWNQTTTYSWETGHNAGNKKTWVTDSTGAVVSFDAPIVFRYKHSLANDANGHLVSSAPSYGRTYLLQYSGNGDLWGIPWGDSANGDWRPEFGIQDGIPMGPTKAVVTDDNGKDFVILAREKELVPVAAPGDCTDLTLSQPAQPLPTGADGTPSNINDPEPTPDNEAPAVIGGELTGI